jgi:5'(3')-deoxyribonucleotidase
MCSVTPNKKKWIIFLDMDGVCVDWHKAAIAAVGRDYEKTMAEWPKGGDDAAEVFGMDAVSFYAALETRGAKHWIEMEEYPGFREFYESLTRLGDVMFLSTPTQDPQCLSGKVKWLQDRFGEDYTEFVFTPKKELLAGPRTILIDDSEEKIQKFGPNGILFPQRWNMGREFDTPQERFDYALRAVKQLIKDREAND